MNESPQPPQNLKRVAVFTPEEFRERHADFERHMKRRKRILHAICLSVSAVLAMMVYDLRAVPVAWAVSVLFLIALAACWNGTRE